MGQLFPEDSALGKEVLGLSLWIWIAIAIAVVVIIIVGIIIAVCVKKSKKKNASTENAEVKPVESEQQAATSAPAEEEKKAVAEDTVVVPVKEEPVKEEKPVQKTATKTTAKKTAPAKTAQKDESEAPKVYHVSKRASDKKWQVKAEGADKALRLFFTQADAIEYAKKVAGNQSGRIVVHKEGGGFRKLNY